MPRILNKARRVYREEGILQLIRKSVRFGYDNFIRTNLPRQEVQYNGIRVLAARLGDSIIPWQETDIPGYEGALLRGIRDHTTPGDTITIVGGGWGVSSVVAAECVGDDGHVTTFEGSPEAVKNVIETVEFSGLTERVTVNHAIVGEGISLLGENGTDVGTETVRPSLLPECDLLVLDCEGAELKILSELEIEPEAIVVETHGMYGATEPEVRSLLDEIGYKVLNKEIAEERKRESCMENGIFVLTALSC